MPSDRASRRGVVSTQKKHLAAGAAVCHVPAVADYGRWLSACAWLLAIAMWALWSVVVVALPAAGFDYSANQLFWLAALPGLSGATLRLFCAFLLPIFGGRRWSAVATALLLVPALGIGVAVQDPGTGYPTMLVLALLCGLGGAAAQRRDATLAALGVPLAQWVIPLAISVALFGSAGGAPQHWAGTGAGRPLWLQNAGFMWVPLILCCAVLAWRSSDAAQPAAASLAEQSAIFTRRHTWIMCWLCTGAFGALIGSAAGLPLLVKISFPAVDPLAWTFLAPLAGVLAMALGAPLARRVGAARAAFGAFCVMTGAALGVLRFLPHDGLGGSFAGFLAMFMLLSGGAGAAHAATTRMIALLFAAPDGSERAAVLGFTATVAGFGAFFIPKSYGTAIALTGSAAPALWWCAAFYASCAAVAWRWRAAAA